MSLLAAGQEWLAQHFSRGVPPIAMWHRVATEEGANGAPLLVGALGWLECRLREEVAVGTHTFFVCEVLASELGVDAPALVRVREDFRRPRADVDAVVFDLDGVLLDSEHVWDEVREELARERGGRWHERAQGDMMGMSSPEWSRYMHDVIGLSESAEGDQRGGRPTDACTLCGACLPLIDGAVAAVERVATALPPRSRILI